jgi:exopolyphosphatase
MNEHLATIDIGTNSVHMAIVHIDEQGNFEILAREKESVRLGSGSHDMDMIKPEAMERTIKALARFSTIASEYNATIRAVATSAVREASNKMKFTKLLKEECGISCEVISGVEEARLIYMGILMGMDVFDRSILAIDIGGGSTEFLIGKRGIPAFATSLKLGAIRLTDRFFPGSDLQKDQIKSCRKFLRTQLSGIQQELQQHSFEAAIGSSGTIETLAAMCSGNPTEPDEKLRASDLMAITEKICALKTAEERGRLPGLDRKRADIIPAGAILLCEIVQFLNISEILISKYALREGIISDSMHRAGMRSPGAGIRYASAQSLSQKFTRPGFPGLDSLKHSAFLAEKICRQLMSLELASFSENDLFLLRCAILLHNTGMVISHSSHHKHSHYIIKNSDTLAGFTGAEIETIALLARYHRKSAPSDKQPEFAALSTSRKKTIRELAAILRIAIALNRSGKNSIVDLRVLKENEGIKIVIKARSDSSLDLEAAELKSQLFTEAYGLSVCLELEGSTPAG